jgi:hypothetical protein
MKKKIIITEAQYNKLQEFLFETTDVNHTLDFVKVGDVLKFKTSTGSDYTINIKHVDHNSNEILGDNHGNKIRFSFDSYDEQNKKLNYNQLDTNTQKYIPKTADVHELDIERGGKVLPIPDIGGNKQPEPTPVSNQDDVSKPVELDPNIPEKPEEEGENYDEMIDNIEAEFASDDIFRKALYKQPSFLERLKGEITGTKPKGSGIIIANQLINSYRDKGSNDFLNADFRKDYKALFKPLERYDLEYEVDGKIDYIVLNGEREAKVGNTNDKNQRKLIDVNKNFEILVTKNISTEKIPNYFLCYISTYSIEKGNKNKNNAIPVKLQFLDSTGFKVKNK